MTPEGESAPEFIGGPENTPDSGPDLLIRDVPPPPPQIIFTRVVVDLGTKLNDVIFVGDKGVAYGDGLFFSSDKGGTWKSVSPAPWVGEVNQVVAHPEGQILLAVGGTTQAPYNGLILISQDNGESWQVSKVLQANSEGEDLRLEGAVWVTNLIGIAVGADGTLWRTTDKGLQWEVYDTLPAEWKSTSWGSIIIHDNALYLSGGASTILKSVDNGASWTLVTQGQDKEKKILRMAFLKDKNTGIAVGEGGVALISRNDGKDWSPISLNLLPGETALTDVAQNGDTNAFLVNGRSFWLSKNSGSFWRSFEVTVDELPLNDRLTGAFFIEPKVVMVTTTRGTILRGELQ